MFNKALIKDVVEFIKTGKTPPSEEKKYFEGDFNWFTPTDLGKEKILSNSTRTLTRLALEDKKIISYPKDTLLISCIGDIGKLGITSEESSSNQQITGIKPKDILDVNYLYYWFVKNRYMLQHYSNTSVVPIINNKSIQSFEITFPEIEEQKRIAEILDIADSVRKKDKQIIDKYNELIQSIFFQMFGDPVINDKGWDKKGFMYFVTDIKNGITRRPKSFDDEKGDLVLKLKDIKINFIDFEGDNRIILTESEKDKFLVSKNDILFIRVNGNPEYVGRCAMFLDYNEPVYFNDHIMRIKCDSNLFNPLLMSYYLNSKYGKREIIKSVKTSAGQYSISREGLENISFINPPIELQNKFAEYVEIIEKQKEIVKKNLDKSNELFESLLSKFYYPN